MLMNESNYRITVYRYLDGDSIYWVAKAAEFPSVSGVGETRAAALRDLDELLKQVICTLREIDAPVPDEYLYDPDSTSGRLTLRLPKSLHKELIYEAEP